MSKEEFFKLYNEASIRITGQASAIEEKIASAQYEAFLSLVDLSGSDAGFPDFTGSIYPNGVLDWDFVPRRNDAPHP